jgi:hypothetical protein
MSQQLSFLSYHGDLKFGEVLKEFEKTVGHLFGFLEYDLHEIQPVAANRMDAEKYLGMMEYSRRSAWAMRYQENFEVHSKTPTFNGKAAGHFTRIGFYCAVREYAAKDLPVYVADSLKDQDKTKFRKLVENHIADETDFFQLKQRFDYAVERFKKFDEVGAMTGNDLETLRNQLRQAKMNYDTSFAAAKQLDVELKPKVYGRSRKALTWLVAMNAIPAIGR